MAITKVGDIATINDTGSASYVITVGAGGVASGNTIVVRVVTNGGVGSITSIKDSRNNVAFTILEDFPNGTTSTDTVIAAYTVATAVLQNDTITIASAFGTKGGLCSVFSGVALTADGANGHEQFGTAWNTGSIVTTNANDLLLSVGGNGGATAATDTPTAGWTDDLVSNLGGGGMTICQYQIVAATGTYTGGGTLSNAQSWSSAIASLQASGGGGAPTFTGFVPSRMPLGA